MTKSRLTIFAAAAAMALSAGPAMAQVEWDRTEAGCERSRGGGDTERYCETRVVTLGVQSRLEVDPGMNGAISVEGWSRNEIQLTAKVTGHARSEARAQAIAREVRVRMRGGRITVDEPDTGRREGWSVSFELMVPRTTDLDLEAHNGGISIDGVRGDIRFQTMNGGVHLVDVGGDVSGETTNGGLDVHLSGSRWDGTGLDARTVNGGITVTVPEDYSAEFETGTVNGGIDVDFPVRVRGRIGRSITTTLGDGGPPVRVKTTNGGVRVERGGEL